MANKKPASGQRHAASVQSDSSDDYKSQYEDWVYWAHDHWLQHENNQKTGPRSFLASVLLGSFSNGAAKLFIAGRVIEVPISNAIRQKLEASSIGLGDDILVFYEMRDSIPIITEVWFSNKSSETANNSQEPNAVGEQIDLLSKALGTGDKALSFDNETPPKVNLLDEDNSAAKQHEDNSLSDDKHREQLKRVFKALQKLPAGEVARIADTSEKKLEKWAEHIPRIAPELYENRPASEKLPDFLRRVYGALNLLDGSMSTGNLEVLDLALAKSIRAWIRRHGSLPNDIDIPATLVRPKGSGLKRAKDAKP